MMRLTRASNGLSNLSLFVRFAAQKPPDLPAAVAGVNVQVHHAAALKISACLVSDSEAFSVVESVSLAGIDG